MHASLYHPALGQTVNYEVARVPDGGDSQTEAVIGMMCRYVEEDVGSPELQADAQAALAMTPGASPTEAVFWWVRRKMRFVRDEATATPFQDGLPANDVVVETLIRPRDMAALIGREQGDCDDFAMYTAALLRTLGVPAAFVTVAAGRESDDFSHVYIAAYPDGAGRIALDTSHGEYPGWETNKARRLREWPIGANAGGLLPLLILVAGAIALCRWS